MITILLTTIVGALCFFLIIINFIEKKNNRIFNNYLISILYIAGLVRLIPILGFILTEWEYESLMNIMPVSVIFLIPLYFLNLNAIVSPIKTKGYIHFIVPILFLICFLIFHPISKLIVGIFIITYSSIYIIMSVILVVRFLRKTSENIIALLFKKKVETWLTVLLVFSIYLYLITIYSIVNFAFSMNLFEFIDTYILTSVGYLITLIFIISNRNLILGRFTPKNHKEISLLFWSFPPLKNIEKKDINQYKNLMPEVLINSIIDWQKDFQQVLRGKLNYSFISERLKVPLYKVKLLFKYHTLLSLSEFTNALKIFNAIILIDEGYLNSFTIESLGKKVGFNSRITFHNNFIKYMGLSVRNYVYQIE